MSMLQAIARIRGQHLARHHLRCVAHRSCRVAETAGILESDGGGPGAQRRDTDLLRRNCPHTTRSSRLGRVIDGPTPISTMCDAVTRG